MQIEETENLILLNVEQNNNNNNNLPAPSNQNNPENNDNNNNNEGGIDDQFIVELPAELREEILLNLDPGMVQNLSQELRDEYYRLQYRDELFERRYENPPQIFQDFYNIVDEDRDLDEFYPKSKLTLVSHKYKIEDILSHYKHNKENSSKILKIFDDEFLENLFIFNVKTVITFKNHSIFNEYFELLNELIMNVHLRHKILDLIFILWICDSNCINNLSKNKQLLEKNSLLKNLHHLYIEMNLAEDYFFDDYDKFFHNFAANYQKEMVKYFLQTAYTNKGSYISLKNKKEYLITKNSQNIKEILGIKYDKGENVLSNLLSLMMISSKSDIKKIFSIKIFTNIIQNCFKSENDLENNKDNNNILHISNTTIEKIIDLFNNFEISLEFNKGISSNNPTCLLNEIMLDNNVYQILLDILLKRIDNLKKNLNIEMDNFFKDKKTDLAMFIKPLPGIILSKLIKLVNNIHDNINKKYDDKKINTQNKNNEKNDKNEKNEKDGKNDKNDKNDKKKLIEKNQKIKTELLSQFKTFLGKINDILFPCWEKLNNLLFDINKMLKDDEKTIASKLNRLIPYLEAFIILSHLQFLFFNEKCDNTTFIIEKNYQKEFKSPARNLILNYTDCSSFAQFFYNFVEKNKKVINLILRRYPKKFPNELIIKISSILDLENKKKYFRHELKKLPTKNEYIRIKVRRNGGSLFADSFGSLYYRKPEQLRSKLMVTFDGEEAIDAGGVKREWLSLLSKEMFNPNYMLFTLAKNGTTYTINCDSGKFNNDHLKQFEFIGKIMAKAIFDGMMLDCYFTRIIYKLITNTPISYHDMEDYDPMFYNSLKWLLENDFTDKETYLTYSYDHENFDEMQTVDLIENGRNIEVTENNKFDYVQKLCSSKLYDTIKPQIDSLLQGFYAIIPQKLISIFNYRELELVISGLPTIDIKDWKNNTVYENYNEESPVIKNFWEIIESFDNDERAEFLQFVTGCSKVPLEGFSALQGIGGINKFKISKVFEKNFERLPTAHTCMNQLDLPEYPNKEILHERLTLAIKEGKVGFGFV